MSEGSDPEHRTRPGSRESRPRGKAREPSHPPKAHVSIHDVTPGNLARVRELVDLVDEAGLRPPLLLVVPGRDWDPASLEGLRRVARRGCPLAGHGWSHRAPPPASLGHRIHGALLSRDQAEHLSRSREELRERVRRCHAWFGEHDLEVGPLYVPPAWALGSLTPGDLGELPFRYYETLSGFQDSRTGRRLRLPLMGFEADTRTRRWALRLSNAANRSLGRLLGPAVRVGFHPRDLELLLAREARAILGRPWRSVRVGELFASADGRGETGPESR